MGAITSLEHRRIVVQPGAEAACSVLVRNTGTVVDQFSVEILGDARPWAEVDSATVNLLPEQESTVVVRFRPPRSPQVPAGEVPFGIRVSSREDPAGSMVEEGTVEVGAFTDIRAELIPRRTAGRRQARCEVAVDNLGNHPVDVQMDAIDPDQNLRFRPERTTLTLQPGTTAFLGLVLRPDQGFLRGPEKTYPYQVRITGADTQPTVVDGAMVQQPLLPKWLPVALAALLAALIALVALWFTVFKQAIQSSARAAAAQEVQAVANTANQAKDTADKAAQMLGIPTEPDAPPPGTDGSATPSAVPSTAPSPTPAPSPPPEPVDFRITTGVDPSDNPVNGPTVFTTFLDDLPAEVIVGRTLAVSDLVLQNPFGDSGILRVLRVTGEGEDRQEAVLLEVGLNNFRDIDYHFLQPLRFKPGERVALAVNCLNPAVDGESDTCDPSASFSGVLEAVPVSPPPITAEPTTTEPAAPEPTGPPPAGPEPTSPPPATAEPTTPAPASPAPGTQENSGN